MGTSSTERAASGWASRDSGDMLAALQPAARVRLRSRPRLTQRQEEVLRLIAVGMTNEEISRELWTAPVTVSAHVRNILDRLRARNRAYAVALWLDEDSQI